MDNQANGTRSCPCRSVLRLGYGQGLDELADEQRKEYLQMVVEQVVIDRDNNVDITMALPIDCDSPEPDSPEPESPEPESVAIASDTSSSGRDNSYGKLRYSWAVELGRFKLGRIGRP